MRRSFFDGDIVRIKEGASFILQTVIFFPLLVFLSLSSSEYIFGIPYKSL
jgi:hypothetical protein